jgi:integrase
MRSCCGAASTVRRDQWLGMCVGRCIRLRCASCIYVLSAAFRRAVRWDWIDHSPTPDVELPAQPPPQPQPPSPTEAAQILGEASCVHCGGATWTSRRMCWWYRRGSRRPTGEMWETDTKLHQRRHIALDPVTIAVLTN